MGQLTQHLVVLNWTLLASVHVPDYICKTPGMGSPVKCLAADDSYRVIMSGRSVTWAPRLRFKMVLFVRADPPGNAHHEELHPSILVSGCRLVDKPD